jgi:hypothetical protein
MLSGWLNRHRATAPKAAGPVVALLLAASSHAAVAPMMDWTDSPKILLGFNDLEAMAMACLLYVSSNP